MSTSTAGRVACEPRTAFVLAGGAALGAVQAGMVHALYERGIAPDLRWQPLPGNLIDRRGAALAPPILLAAALNVAAFAGLAGIAGFHAVYASLTRIQGPWLGAVPASLATSAIGYYLAYRSIYAAEGGYKLSRRQLTAVVAARPARCVR
jgi:hypothetical protein